jgi:hypothetical protein
VEKTELFSGQKNLWRDWRKGCEKLIRAFSGSGLNPEPAKDFQVLSFKSSGA